MLGDIRITEVVKLVMDDMSFFAVVRYSACNLLTIISLTFGNGEIERGTSTIPQLRLRQTGLIEMVGDHWSPLQCLAYLSKFIVCNLLTLL